MKLPPEYYLHQDVVHTARTLLGKKLVTLLNGNRTSGFISETEAYNGIKDKACHAWNGKYTGRTQTLYKTGGVAYVYLCYGMHNLFNVVTCEEGNPCAVLVRAIQPAEGVDVMLKRTDKKFMLPAFCQGPGKVTRALGINRTHNGINLNGMEIWIEDALVPVNEKKIKVTPRIGVDYAGKDARLP